MPAKKKISLDRIKTRVGWHGETYQQLVGKIIAVNQNTIAGRVVNIKKEDFTKQIKRAGKRADKVIIPDQNSVIPKKGDLLIKGAQQGELLMDTLRDRLTSELKKTLSDFKVSGKTAYIKPRGKEAGKINPDLVNQFKNNITNVFLNYTKKNKALGVPPNVHTIAVTETRSTIDRIKDQYNERLLQENKGKIKLYKTWVQNKSLAKKPRTEHSRVNGRRVLYKTNFKVPNKQGGFDLMKHPHDPDAPADQVIGCNCDYITTIKIL